LVSLYHSWNLSRFWALWFCQYHHVTFLFIVRWSILKREIKYIRINLSLLTWFFFVPFSSLSKIEGINMILTWATLPWAGNNGSSHYMTKTSLLIHATSSLWFNRDWHLEICDSLCEKPSGQFLGLIVMSHWLGEVWIQIQDSFILFFFLSLFRLKNRVCLSRGVQVAGAAWCVATMIVAGVGDLVQRTGNDHIGWILGGQAVERSSGTMCGLHLTRGD
jgi:hypothetical protein